MIEKAWAKINGSYEAIVTGSAWDALKFLVPYPIERWTYDWSQHTKEEIWDKIEDAIDGKYMITCSTRDENQDLLPEEFEKLGLTSNHWFSISGQYNVKYLGKQTMLLKIWNPWNKQEWKGDWSDSDSKWTPSIKSAVGFESKRDGEFYISFEDFLKYLSSSVIWKNWFFFMIMNLLNFLIIKDHIA